MITKEKLDEMIRVNQAGEYGAKRIYQGQMDILKNSQSIDEIKHMAEQEEEHLRVFNKLMVERRVRPTILSPLWHVAGYALGAGTALLGEKAAMACTEAVESVIDEHYREQLGELEQTKDEELKKIIKKCHEEELEHMHTARDHDAMGAPLYAPLTFAVKSASKLAIWLSKRI